MAPETPQRAAARAAEKMGRGATGAVAGIGFGASLLAQSAFWLAVGPTLGQPVRLTAIAEQMMEIGVRALPIVTILSATIGAMLAIQGIDTLERFGAEAQVVIGIALGVTREFGPVITGILVAGRSGSAIAARVGSMKNSQELDALTVMGIEPVRFLAAPALVATIIMVPSLTIWSDFVAIIAGGLYVSADLGMDLSAYLARAIQALGVDDVLQGLGKSLVFAILIAAIGILNGALVTGGSEGVGRATTQSVVQSITAIVVADMAIAWVLTR